MFMRVQSKGSWGLSNAVGRSSRTRHGQRSASDTNPFGPCPRSGTITMTDDIDSTAAEPFALKGANCDDNIGLSYVHWERIAESIEREKQDAMSMRVRQLWAPVLSTFLISVAVQFVALRVPQLPPWVFFTRNGVSIVLAPLWMLALPFIGAWEPRSPCARAGIPATACWPRWAQPG